MLRVVRVVVAALIAAVLLGDAIGQSTPTKPIKTTLCELVKTPEQFNGKLVQFRAEYVSDLQRTSFEDEKCGAVVAVGVSHIFDELKPGVGQYAYTEIADEQSDEFKHLDRLPWKTIEQPITVHLLKNENYLEFRKFVDAKYRWKDGGFCRNCPLYRTTVTATGRFDDFRKEWVAVRTDASAHPYIWGPGGPLMRFVLQSVSDVAATRIDPSVYSELKRRNVSDEEAHDLVCVLAGSCEGGDTVLLPANVRVDAGFYHLDVWNSISQVGFFDVDARTGDVWNGVICERFDSPSLVRLQRKIRKRIGLTEEEYRRIPKTGPMCEPEMPGVGRGK